MEGHKRLRVLFVGMGGRFSRIALERLLAAGGASGAVIGVLMAEQAEGASIARVPPEPAATELPLLTPHVTPNVVHLAWQRQIPVWAMGEMDDAGLCRLLHTLAPDAALVACFPWRVSPAALAIPRHGFLNLHPSLLPDFRGPEPLFWTFRQGVRETGVTVHWMDEGLDTGPIALQAPLTLPDGTSGAEAERKTAESGGDLLAKAVDQLATGRLSPTPQSDGGSVYPAPTAADFRIPVAWPAQRAFNFVRGTQEWGRPYPIVDADGDVVVVAKTAVSWREEQGMASEVVRNGRYALVQFATGVLQITV